MLLAAAGLALLGLATGSFLTVVIRRTGTRSTIVWGRSRCPQCRRTLRWFELLPILSFLLQRGRCRSCRRPISPLYPVVEFLCAFLFVALAVAVVRGVISPPPFSTDAVAGTLGTQVLWFLYYAFFSALAIAISAYDFERGLIPLALVRPLLVVGAGGALIRLAAGGGGREVFALAAFAGAVFVLFWGLWFFSAGRAMGRGDADVALAIALVLGPAAALTGLLFAFWIGAILGILLVSVRRLGWSSEIPFAPFLFGGAIAALFLSSALAPFNPFSYVF
ncbi:MAG: prepilin peptidase [bacterium]|nr:prepilin peptidase [bacterium]